MILEAFPILYEDNFKLETLEKYKLVVEIQLSISNGDVHNKYFGKFTSFSHWLLSVTTAILPS